MKTHKIILCIILVLTVLMNSLILSAYADNDKDKSKEIAKESLKGYKQKLEGVKFKFKNNDEFQNSTIGDNISVYNFDITKLSQGTSDLKSAMYDLGLIQFIVNADDRAVTRLTLKKDGDTYKRNGFGGNGENLAKGLTTLSLDEESEPRLVRFGSAEFLYVEKNNEESLVYISLVPIDELISYREYKSEEIIPILQKLSQNMIANSNGDGGVSSNINRPTLLNLATKGTLAILLTFSCIIFIRKNKVFSLKNKGSI